MNNFERYILKIRNFNLKKLKFERILKRRCKRDYDLYIAIDLISLDILNKVVRNKKKIITFILEGQLYLKELRNHHIAEILKKTLMIVFADKDRERDFSKIIGHTFNNVRYLPVSLRPVLMKTNRNSDNIRIIYSGYFAEWACIHELIELFNQINDDNFLLTFQGHSMGTEKYLNSSMKLSNNKINFLTDYIDDCKYINFLSDYDIGLAVYNDLESDGNFSNIIYSSGKIASYLWAGLAIITNIDNDLTKNPPFIYLKDLTVSSFNEKLNSYINSKEIYRDAAYKLANKIYNFDKNMSVIIDDIKSL